MRRTIQSQDSEEMFKVQPPEKEHLRKVQPPEKEVKSIWLTVYKGFDKTILI